jgi:hypothetical protein
MINSNYVTQNYKIDMSKIVSIFNMNLTNFVMPKEKIITIHLIGYNYSSIKYEENEDYNKNKYLKEYYQNWMINQGVNQSYNQLLSNLIDDNKVANKKKSVGAVKKNGKFFLKPIRIDQEEIQTLRKIDSKILLKKTCELVRSSGYEIGNIDSTLCLERPKVMKYAEQMKTAISEVAGIDTSQVSIKATTSEKMGFVGREEGVNAYAVALIYLV